MSEHQVCTCIATNHPLHEAGKCDEPPQSRGGICTTCRYWFTNQRKEAEA